MKTKILLVEALGAVAVVLTFALFPRVPVADNPVPPAPTIAIPFAAWPASVAPALVKAETALTGATVISPAVEPVSAGPSAKSPAPKKSPKTKVPIQDPDARLALSLVGADPEAEAYWVSAINDPNLPANERKDLIEDLNEDGLSDPKHPGPEDLPLILNRIRLIEELAANSMDQVNADAFLEAYQDLVKLAN